MAADEQLANQLRSIECEIGSPLEFYNESARKVRLTWLDFEGAEVEYNVMSETDQRPYEINSFVTHPWIAVDKANGERLLLNSEEVFYPPRPQYVLVRAPHRGQVILRVRPTKVVVTQPVYNAQRLEDYCCKYISCLLTAQEVDKLLIPTSLKREIKKYIQTT